MLIMYWLRIWFQKLIEGWLKKLNDYIERASKIDLRKSDQSSTRDYFAATNQIS